MTATWECKSGCMVIRVCMTEAEAHVEWAAHVASAHPMNPHVVGAIRITDDVSVTLGQLGRPAPPSE